MKNENDTVAEHWTLLQIKEHVRHLAKDDAVEEFIEFADEIGLDVDARGLVWALVDGLSCPYRPEEHEPGSTCAARHAKAVKVDEPS